MRRTFILASLTALGLALSLPMHVAVAAEDCRAQLGEAKRHWNAMTPGTKKVEVAKYITTADQALIEQDEAKCLANLAEAKRLLGY